MKDAPLDERPERYNIMRRAFLVTVVALVGSLIIPSTETLQAQTGQGAKVFEQVAQRGFAAN